MSVLVVGSVGLDTLETPQGNRSDVLGGSASHLALAAAAFGVPVRLVGVVGTDFPSEHRSLLEERGVDLGGLTTEVGATFRWHGRYDDFNVAQSLATHLNVFEHFDPAIPEAWRDTPFVMLGNIDPVLQGKVLASVRSPRLTVMDTMNFWIGSRRDEVLAMAGRVDVVLVNDQEARDLTLCHGLVDAARELLRTGCRVVVVKRGEHGALMVTAEGDLFFCPAHPVERVIDTTGAGDSFAGGFAGYLSRSGSIDGRALRRAVVHGCIMGSFNVEGFGVERTARVTSTEIDERYRALAAATSF